MTRSRTIFVIAAVTGALALAPASAGAATTCARDASGVLTVSMSAHADQALMQLAGGTDIRIYGKDGLLVCSGALATVSNTETVLIVDESDDPSTAAGNDGGTLVSISEPASFAPGKTVETGVSEIEFLVDVKGGYDRVALGGNSAQRIVLGSAGAGWDGDADADMLGMPFDQVVLSGGEPTDSLNAFGGGDVGPALTTADLQINGGGGDDFLTGGSGRERINGGPGADSIAAFGGDDVVSPGPGNDTVRGGAGTDTVSFGDAGRGVSVDLAESQRQDTGEGNDEIGESENLTGSPYADRLTGDFTANVLRGGFGDDVLDGRGGADELNGEEGSDTASYASFEAGVNVDLAQTSQPTDNDKFFLIENLIGSPFADTLAGNAGANRIEARDGRGDRVSCGGGADTAVTDRRSLDAVAADCDTVDALPEPPRPPAAGGGGGSGAGAGPVRADTSLSFSLAGAKRQRVLRRRAVQVKVRCPQERCTTVTAAAASVRVARSTRKLRARSVRTTVTAGRTRTVTLGFSRRQIAALKKAVAAGQRPRVTVAATATDAAGNRVRRTFAVRVKP